MTVQVALSLTFVVGFAAMSVDIGTIYVAQAELQRAADAAAMAAANRLSASTDQYQMQLDAKDLANEFATKNPVWGTYAGLNMAQDVEFGRALPNPDGKFEFNGGVTPYDAVRVRVRRAEGSPGGPIQLAFARLFGQDKKNLQAHAVAMLIPRDMVVVIDLSGSMNYDSQLRTWDRTDGGYTNTRDIWASLDGPPPAKPYIPGPETATQYASDTGPTVGVMSNWGSPLLPGSYNPSSDNGLWHIRKSQNTSVTAITNSLVARGYNSAERSALMSGSLDSDNWHFRRRTGVMLGLAEWKSGKSGGFPGGNGDNKLDASEVTWIGYPPYRVNWEWWDYIDWNQTNGHAKSAFQYRYGLKTFVNFLLQSAREHTKSHLAATPQQPLQALKDAVQSMVDTISAEDSLDHLALMTYGTTGKWELPLSDDLQLLADTLYARQAAHFNPNTNIGDGLMLAINELKSPRARPNATKMIVLMSDGVPNVSENGLVSDAMGKAWALNQAQKAADEGFMVICISVGYMADRPLMQQIAGIANGQEFYAAGDPEQYTQELQTIFKTLGGKRPVALIE